MIAEWLIPVERIIVAARVADLRIVGFTSPHLGSGVSTLARQVAEYCGRSEIRTLLVDLTAPVSEETTFLPQWSPDKPGAMELIKTAMSGYDQLTCLPTSKTRFLFNNTELLRRTFDTELDQYAAIFVDLPPLLGKRSDLLSSLATALACDGVCMVCVTGRLTHNELKTASDMLNSARINLLGIVLNDVVPSRNASVLRKEPSPRAN